VFNVRSLFTCIIWPQVTFATVVEDVSAVTHFVVKHFVVIFQILEYVKSRVLILQGWIYFMTFIWTLSNASLKLYPWYFSTLRSLYFCDVNVITKITKMKTEYIFSFTVCFDKVILLQLYTTEVFSEYLVILLWISWLYTILILMWLLQVEFSIGEMKRSSSRFAAAVRVVIRNIQGKCQGFVATLKDNYGFIENSDHDKEVFFHFRYIHSLPHYVQTCLLVRFQGISYT
jgi:hypothetical protein